MMSARAYRPALTHEQALDELRRRAGAEFDPDVVRAFLAVVDEHRGAGVERATDPDLEAGERRDISGEALRVGEEPQRS
jgi:HD-GYP domain-containing protein (c-di-GMP phosphodiesterase class II)